MSRRISWRVGFSILALVAAGFLYAPAPGQAQTQTRGSERRDDRQDARDTRQTGRDAAQDVKKACKEGDEKTRAECRQQKRDVKQKSREVAHDAKTSN